MQNTNTRKKLEEAIFFYNKLVSSTEHFANETVYYLSAFLSASQSTVYIMGKEFGSEKQYKENLFMKSELYLKFYKARHVIIHQEVPNLKHKIETSFGPQGLVVRAGQTVNIPLKPFAGLRTEVQAEHINQLGEKMYSIANQNRDLCISFFDNQYGEKREFLFSTFLRDAEEYLFALKSFVEECVKATGKASP
jgi:hypothetical protein